jgi:hypothetical protein
VNGDFGQLRRTARLPVLSHYNVETRTMYVDELDRVLRINRDGNIDIIRNGDDGVIFAPAGDARHADIDMRPGELLVYDGLFTKHILNCVKWDTTKGISEDCAKQLYKTVSVRQRPSRQRCEERTLWLCGRV